MTTVPVAGSKKVLVIDDSKAVRSAVAAELMRHGLLVIEACDGMEGVARCRDNPDVALIICDLNMPKLNGLEVLRVAHQLSKAPFIMMTTDGDALSITRAKKAGASGWLIKPLQKEAVAALAQRVA